MQDQVRKAGIFLFTWFSMLEAAALSSSMSLDTFVAGFAYGSNRIRIPFLSVQIINVVCSAMLGIAILVGTVVRQFLPARLTAAICFLILFALGVCKLLDSLTKALIRKRAHLEKQLSFSMFNLKFILKLYADPEAADVDASRVISPAEAATLAVALSLDGIAVGFGAALGHVNGLAVFLLSFVTDMIGVMLGAFVGQKIAHKLRLNLSWLSGVVLIALAILKLT